MRKIYVIMIFCLVISCKSNKDNEVSERFKLVKSYDRPSNYGLNGKVYTFEVTYPDGDKFYWSGLIETINSSTATRFGECTGIWYFSNKPGSSWLVKNNWWVDKKLNQVDSNLIYNNKKFAVTKEEVCQ